MIHAQLADRGEEPTTDDVLGDGTEANWRELLAQVIVYAADDYVATLFPECAPGWIGAWFRRRSEAYRKRRIAEEREWLAEFWQDGAGEWADWVGRRDYKDKVLRVSRLRYCITTQERIKDAFTSQANGSYRRLPKRSQHGRCVECGAKISFGAKRCKSCSLIGNRRASRQPVI